jgi:hypothetical protein
MNTESSEQQVRQVLSTSHPEFYPPSTQWVTCKNYIYIPHSNECGIHTLLALSIQAVHPHPHEKMFLTYIHQNLAQIGRTWIARALLNSHIPPESLNNLLSCKIANYLGPSAQSVPRSLIVWGSSSQVFPPKSLNEKHENALYKLQHTPFIASTLNPLAQSFLPRHLSSSHSKLSPSAKLFSKRPPTRPETTLEIL